MAQLSEQQYLIGRLPWIEVNRGEERLRFARLDLSLLPDSAKFELQGALAENGISVTHLPGGVGSGYLQVSLGDQSGKNLDVYRMAATDWSVSPDNDKKLLAVGNELHSQEFLKNAHNLGFNSDAVLDGLKQLHARYGVAVGIDHAANGSPHLVASVEQAAQLSKLKELPVSLDNLPYNHLLEEAKVSKLVEAKPSAGARALTGATFGIVASIPAVVATYQIGKEEVESGKVPVGAANFASKAAAETVVGSVAGGTVAVAAIPLLTLPPPAGEIAYGAAVLGAGYLGAEGTKKLMEQADYYLVKAQSYFQNDEAQASFAGHVRENAEKNGQNPELAVVLSYKMISEQVNSQAAAQSLSPVTQGVER